MNGYLPVKPHFWSSHGSQNTSVNGVYCDGWIVFQPAFQMINTETFVLADGTKVHSNLPFTYYKPPQGDASTPPASMRMQTQEYVVKLLTSRTVTELICTRTGMERWELPMLEPFNTRVTPKINKII
jgi:hypothetical protein